MRRTVKGCIPVHVDGVDIVASLVAQLDRLERFLVVPGILTKLPDADACRRHQRRRVFDGRNRWIRTVVEQKPHVRHVGQLCRLQEWCGADAVQHVSSAVARLFRHPRVRIRAVLEQLLRELETRHPPR